MNYTSLVTKKKQYKYSANICFDMKDDEKLAGFIPNITTTEILREYLLGIINGNADVHSRILYGSYGTGKSHLLTVLSDLLGHENTNGKGIVEFEKHQHGSRGGDAEGRQDSSGTVAQPDPDPGCSIVQQNQNNGDGQVLFSYPGVEQQIFQNQNAVFPPCGNEVVNSDCRRQKKQQKQNTIVHHIPSRQGFKAAEIA